MPYLVHPAGWFDATILDHGFDRSEKGSEFLWVLFETVDGNAGPRQITGRFYLTEGAAPYTVQKVRRMGYVGSDLGALADGRALQGNGVRIRIAHETYGGKTRAKVDAVGNSGPPHDAAAAENVRRFNALLDAEPVVKVPTRATGSDQPDTPDAAAGDDAPFDVF